MKSRIKRLIDAFRPQNIEVDDDFALRILSVDEQIIYSAMDVRDRNHAVEVARKLASCYPEAPAEVARAALLHDSGKSCRPYQPLERIFTGLFKVRVPAEPLRKGIYGAFQVRQHHPQYGAEKIRDPQVAAIVLEHHNPKTHWGKCLHQIDKTF